MTEAVARFFMALHGNLWDADSLRLGYAEPPPSMREALGSLPKGSRLGPLSEGAVSEADWGSEGSWRAAPEGVPVQSHRRRE